MSYAKYFYPSKNYNDDIDIHQKKNLKLDFKPLTTTNKNNQGMSSNLNYQNNFSNLNRKNSNENFKNLNNNFSSSLKDQILSPGDDDISPNYDKNKAALPKGTPYLDDDIIFNKFNYYLTKNKNALSLINNQIIKPNDYLNINSNLNKNIKNNKKTLILDLDETLVHSSFKPINYNNILHKPDIFLTINFRNNDHNVYVLKRPYVHEFLKEMNKIFNIIIFTASVKEYANPLLNTLDTEKVIQQRYFREDCCIGPTGKFVKDLKILNMNLKDLILVDNNPISYSYNRSNGIPIKTWHYDKTDQELIKLIPVLQFLANVNDVRDYIPKLVENDEIDFSKINFMINELNNENEENKILRPRAKSQKKFLARNKDKSRSCNYGYKNINNNDMNVLNANDINQGQKYEDSKMNIEEINTNKYINNYLIDKPNLYNINSNGNYNLKNEYNHHQRNIIDYNNRNTFYNNKNEASYSYNNYIVHNNDINTNSNNDFDSKEQKKYQPDIFKNEENKEQTVLSYSKNKIESIQSYNKKNSFNNNNISTLNNNFYFNEYRNLHQRNKTEDISNIIKEKIDNLNTYKDKIKNKYNNIYKNIEANNNIKGGGIQYLKDNNNINISNNNNYLNNIQNKEKNKNNNYIYNYESKINYGLTTPQINNKFISNYSLNNFNTKNSNNNINSNMSNNNNDSNDLNYNIDNKNDNDIINNTKNIINKNNDSNYNRFYKDLNKGDYIFKYKYNCLKKPTNNMDIQSNRNTNKDIGKNLNLSNIYDYDNNIHSSTAINFYSSKINNNNKIDDYNNLNLNSNLNKNLNVLQNDEETKINSIINKEEKNDLKIDNALKKHNSPYKISKETNYYIKRRMKLNKEKISHKKIENGNKNELYVSFNNPKTSKNNNYENNNNNYYNTGKYYRNEIYFY